MERKNNLFTSIFIVVLIIIFVYGIPLMLINSYSKIYTNMYTSNINDKDTMLSTAYDALLNSDIDTEYKNYVTIIKKTNDSSLLTMQFAYSILFTYYIVFTCLLLLIAGICLKKYNANLSKMCIIASIILFICVLIYIII